jgi:peptide/nickel transport system substrate-binding protein
MEAGYDVKFTEIVVEQLRRAGFDAEQVIMERTAFLADVYTKSQFEICINSVTAFYPDADFITYMRYHSRYMGGGNNFVMVNNPKLDELLDRARVSQDDEVRAKAYREVAQVIKDEAVIVPIMSYMVSVAANKDLKGLEASNTARVYAYDFSW